MASRDLGDERRAGGMLETDLGDQKCAGEATITQTTKDIGARKQ